MLSAQHLGMRVTTSCLFRTMAALPARSSVCLEDLQSVTSLFLGRPSWINAGQATFAQDSFVLFRQHYPPLHCMQSVACSRIVYLLGVLRGRLGMSGETSWRDEVCFGQEFRMIGRKPFVVKYTETFATAPLILDPSPYRFPGIL